MSHTNLTLHNLKQNHANSLTIQDEINRIINHHLHRWDLPYIDNKNTFHFLEPDIEVRNTPKEVIVSAELPGLDPNDINIQFSDEGYLTINGEKKHQTEEKTEGFYFSERSYGLFQRIIDLPTSDINNEKITAEFDKGVLTITLPKSENTKKKFKKISINSK